MSVQFLKTVGLLFNFLVAFEANQGVTLSAESNGFENKSEVGINEMYSNY